MKRRNFPDRKEKRQQAAVVRQEKRSKRSVVQQLSALDGRRGNSTKERRRLVGGA